MGRILNIKPTQSFCGIFFKFYFRGRRRNVYFPIWILLTGYALKQNVQMKGCGMCTRRPCSGKLKQQVPTLGSKRKRTEKKQQKIMENRVQGKTIRNRHFDVHLYSLNYATTKVLSS